MTVHYLTSITINIQYFYIPIFMSLENSIVDKIKRSDALILILVFIKLFFSLNIVYYEVRVEGSRCNLILAKPLCFGDSISMQRYSVFEFELIVICIYKYNGSIITRTQYIFIQRVQFQIIYLCFQFNLINQIKRFLFFLIIQLIIINAISTGEIKLVFLKFKAINLIILLYRKIVQNIQTIIEYLKFSFCYRGINLIFIKQHLSNPFFGLFFLILMILRQSQDIIYNNNFVIRYFIILQMRFQAASQEVTLNDELKIVIIFIIMLLLQQLVQKIIQQFLIERGLYVKALAFHYQQFISQFRLKLYKYFRVHIFLYYKYIFSQITGIFSIFSEQLFSPPIILYTFQNPLFTKFSANILLSFPLLHIIQIFQSLSAINSQFMSILLNFFKFKQENYVSGLTSIYKLSFSCCITGIIFSHLILRKLIASGYITQQPVPMNSLQSKVLQDIFLLQTIQFFYLPLIFIFLILLSKKSQVIICLSNISPFQIIILKHSTAASIPIIPGTIPTTPFSLQLLTDFGHQGQRHLQQGESEEQLQTVIYPSQPIAAPEIRILFSKTQASFTRYLVRGLSDASITISQPFIIYYAFSGVKYYSYVVRLVKLLNQDNVYLAERVLYCPILCSL